MSSVSFCNAELGDKCLILFTSLQYQGSSQLYFQQFYNVIFPRKALVFQTLGNFSSPYLNNCQVSVYIEILLSFRTCLWGPVTITTKITVSSWFVYRTEAILAISIAAGTIPVENNWLTTCTKLDITVSADASLSPVVFRTPMSF